MSLTLHSARKTHLKEIPFKEPTFQLNYVHNQFSQQTKPVAFLQLGYPVAPDLTLINR